jgi:hypothetical protein
MEEEKDKEQKTPFKRARSVSLEKVSAKKHKQEQEQEGSAGKKERTCSVEPVTLQPNWTKEQEILPILPALKVSFKKKVAFCGSSVKR